MIKAFFTIVLLALCAGSFASYKAYNIIFQKHIPNPSTLSEPNSGSASQFPKTIEIESGQGFTSIAKTLASADIIQNPKIFYWYARYKKQDRKVKPGFYEFLEPVNFDEALEKLVSGSIKLTTFGFQEGWNNFQILEKLKLSFPHIKETDWKNAIQDIPSNFPFQIPEQAEFKHLEGFLFPNTYKFPVKATAATIVNTLVEQFQTVFESSYIEKGAALGLNPYQIVILASIIEKETGRAEERTRISGVFHNRMKIGMRLQTDPTIIYGIWGRYDGNIRKKDLLEDGPYNTYLRGGLPPTPIANPGKDSLFAAVNPAATKDLYFVGKGDGTHYFSETLAQHNKAVYQYQIKR